MRRVVLASWIVLAGSACTAGRASFAVVQAQQAVRRAQTAGAEEHALYELTMAQAYLAKAREEASFSSYRTSVELARESATWADKAIIDMEKAGKIGPVADSAPPATDEPAAAPPATDEAAAAPPATDEPAADPAPEPPTVEIIEVPPPEESD